jgi:hypothetical protein
MPPEWRIARLVADSAEDEHINAILDREEARSAVIGAFNTDPVKNYAGLTRFYHREPTPQNLVRVFRRVPGLDNDKVTEFLFHPDNQAYVKAFFTSYNMRSDFVTAFRRCFCGPYFLPQEARYMESAIGHFADAYMAANARVFAERQDTVALGVTIVMTNNKLRKGGDAMTVEQFIANGQSGMHSSNLARDRLVAMYQSLVQQPLDLEAKSVTFGATAAPKMKGWLKKKAPGLLQAAVVSFCVLTSEALVWFKDNSQGQKDSPQGMIGLRDVRLVEDPKKSTKFTIVALTGQLDYQRYGPNGPELLHGTKKLEFDAKTPDLRSNWIVRLKRVISTLAGLKRRDTEAPDGESDDDGEVF